MMERSVGARGVSAVVCCHNSGAVVAEAVRALSAQRVPRACGYELVLVDNNCTDDTVARARSSWGDTPHPLRVVLEREPGLIHARRAGLAAAEHEIVLWVDDDNVLASDWVDKLVTIFAEQPGTAGVGGHNEPWTEGARPPWFDEFAGMYAARPQGDGPGLVPGRKALVGAGLAMRRAVLDAVFHEGPPLFLTGRRGNVPLRGEDSEICLRAKLLGWELWYEPSLRLRHRIAPARLNWDYVLDARRGGGRADTVLLLLGELVEGLRPLSFEMRSVALREWWQEWWKNLGPLERINTEGDPLALRKAYLEGLTAGLLDMGRERYRSIRGQLLEWVAATRPGAGVPAHD